MFKHTFHSQYQRFQRSIKHIQKTTMVALSALRVSPILFQIIPVGRYCFFTRLSFDLGLIRGLVSRWAAG